MLIDILLTQPHATQEQISKAIVEDAAAYNRDHYLLDIVMRVGKSRFSLDLFRHWMSKGTAHRCLILVPQTTNKLDWEEKIEKFNKDIQCLIDVYCYASLGKFDIDEYDVILADEGDCMTGEKQGAELKKANPRHWVFMSGTWDSESRTFAKGLCPSFKEIQIDLRLAVKWGIIPKPKVTFVKVKEGTTKVKNTKLYYYDKFKNKDKKPFVLTYDEYISKKKWYNYREFYPSIACTEEEYIDFLNEEIQDARGKVISEIDLHNKKMKEIGSNRVVDFNFNADGYTPEMLRYHNQWLSLTMKRKKFSAQTKMNEVLAVSEIFKKKKVRSIFFTNSVKDAESICPHTFSNKTSAKVVKQQIAAFNAGTVNMLSTCGMLSRGVDFVKVDNVVIGQLDGTTGMVFQKSGRGFLSQGIHIVVFVKDNASLKDAAYARTFKRLFDLSWVREIDFVDYLNEIK